MGGAGIVCSNAVGLTGAGDEMGKAEVGLCGS